MEVSAGKLWGLRRLADSSGRMKIASVDAREPILAPIADKRGLDSPSYDDVAGVKSALTRGLVGDASAILIDPVWGYPEAWPDLRPDRGLLLTLDDAEVTDDAQGRRSSPIANWSPQQIKRLGADGVKLQLWYRPDVSPDVRRHQQTLVRTVGHACTRYDIPFVLQLATYPLAENLPPRTYKRPDFVLEAIRTFTDGAYAVDLFALESPLPADEVPDPEGPEALYCQAQFDLMGRTVGRPWVIVADGADGAMFRRCVSYACRAGASGYLAGEPLWADAMAKFPDIAAIEDALRSESVAYQRALNDLVDRLARPWTEAMGGSVGLAGAGERFPDRYPSANEVR